MTATQRIAVMPAELDGERQRRAELEHRASEEMQRLAGALEQERAEHELAMADVSERLREAERARAQLEQQAADLAGAPRRGDASPVAGRPRGGRRTTRLRKAWCEDCGCIIRLSRKWIRKGLGRCGCGGAFVCSDEDAA